MADLAVFADGLVHDLRNPLNVIRTNVYLLRQKLAGADPKLVRAVDRIDDQVNVAIRILDGVQAFYRSERPSFVTVDLNALVRSVVETADVPDECEIRLELTPDLPAVNVDPQLLGPAVRALLRNACEAAAEGGTVRVATCRHDRILRIEVADTAGGMTEEVAARAFEPFFTTRRAHAGLGLPLARRVARAHGGRAFLEVTPGVGTQAILELPLAGSGAVA